MISKSENKVSNFKFDENFLFHLLVRVLVMVLLFNSSSNSSRYGNKNVERD